MGSWCYHTHEENEKDESVVVSLDDGSSIKASILLGCDGIHSKVCKIMMNSLLKDGEEDKLCNVSCWWGKIDVKDGSEHTSSTTGCWIFGTKQCLGSVVAVPSEGNKVFTLEICLASEISTKSSGYLTRRGRIVLNLTEN